MSLQPGASIPFDETDPSALLVYLASGELTVGRLEVARLDDDRSHPDRGVLRLILEGGR